MTAGLRNSYIVPITCDGFTVGLTGRQLEETIDIMSRIDQRKPENLAPLIVHENSGNINGLSRLQVRWTERKLGNYCRTKGFELPRRNVSTM